jgi:hypothetical protein
MPATAPESFELVLAYGPAGRQDDARRLTPMMYRRVRVRRIYIELQIVNCAPQGSKPPFQDHRVFLEHLLRDSRIPGIDDLPDGTQRYVQLPQPANHRGVDSWPPEYNR